MAVGAHEGIFYIRHEYPLAVERVRAALAECERRGWLGDALAGQRLSAAPERRQGRRRRVRLRRGDRPDRLGRRPARHAAAAAAVPGRVRPVGQADADQQRRDLALVPWIIRHGAEAFAASAPRTARAPRSSPWPARSAAAADRSADGHHPPPDRRGDRRRRRREGARSRRCRSAGPPAAACRRAWPTRRWITNRCARSARSWVPAAWWCWTTPTAWWTSPAISSTSPRTSRAANAPSAASAPGGCSTSSTALRGQGATRSTWRNWSDWRRQVSAGQPVRPGQDGAQPGAHHAALFPRRIRGPPARPLPGRQVHGA